MWLAEHAVHDNDDADYVWLDVFLKFEQLASYARWKINDDRGFRGIEQVEVRSANAVVHLSSSNQDQILSVQRHYGVWGLYAEPGRDCGLLTGHPPRLQPDLHSVIAELDETYFRPQGTSLDALAKKLRSGTRCSLHLEPRENREPALVATAAMLKPNFPPEAYKRFQRHILWNEGVPLDSTEGRQKLLSEVMGNIKWAGDRGAHGLDELKLLEAAVRKAGHKSVAAVLHDIVVVESFLAPAVAAFDFLLGGQGRNLKELGKELGEHWRGARFDAHLDEFLGQQQEIQKACNDEAAAGLWARAAKELGRHRFSELLATLVDLNTRIMEDRNQGAPWVKITNGTIRVDYRDRTGGLPGGREAANLWLHDYYLTPLASLTQEMA